LPLFPGEADDLHQRVGPRLEDHAQQPQRRADALEHQPVVQLAPQRRAPDQIGHRRQLIQPVAHAVQLRRVQSQALDQRRGDVLRLRAFQILGVRRAHLGPHARFAQRRGQRAQQLRSPFPTQARQLAPRGLGGLGGRARLFSSFVACCFVSLIRRLPSPGCRA
jgi:hypothetical protein